MCPGHKVVACLHGSKGPTNQPTMQLSACTTHLNLAGLLASTASTQKHAKPETYVNIVTDRLVSPAAGLIA